MGDVFDLFGDPIPANQGKPGRPQHVATNENRRKVNMLVALGWNNERIASSLRITPPSLRKHYFSELKFRAAARDRLNATVAMKLWAGVEDGNVGAIKEFRKFLDHNDLMVFGQSEHVGQGRPDKPVKLGKKDQAMADANKPDTNSALGELMARRQGALPN